MYVILDLDNGLADASHREHLIAKEPKKWDEYYSSYHIGKDKPVEGSKRVVEKLKELRYEVIVLSDRPEEGRMGTRMWLLESYGLDLADERLILRGVGNMLSRSEYMRQQLSDLRTRLEKKDDFVVITSDAEAWNNLATFGVVLKAPDCWGVLFPVGA